MLQVGVQPRRRLVLAEIGPRLQPAERRVHARLVVRTVAADLAVDSAGLTDIRQTSKVYELTEILTDIDRAIATGAWDRAAAVGGLT